MQCIPKTWSKTKSLQSIEKDKVECRKMLKPRRLRDAPRVMALANPKPHA
jgi:hypothetical protein